MVATTMTWVEGKDGFVGSFGAVARIKRLSKMK